GGGVRLPRPHDTEAVRTARVAFCGGGPVSVRLPAVEEALTGADAGAQALASAARASLTGLAPSHDIHASAQYRREAAAHLLVRGCTTAWERCS
ncbi:hypothetical protein ABT114_50040, partial [Streptomyces sp. NPDC002088]